MLVSRDDRSTARAPESPPSPQDSVDRFVDAWSRIDPELDLSPLSVVQRLGRVRRALEAEIEATFAEFGLNGPDYVALATLRQLDDPNGVPQRRLMRELGLTSGTMSTRVDRLAAQDLVTCTSDPRDRRNTLVALTPAGRALMDRVTPAHIRGEDRMLAALDPRQREVLAGLLRQLLVSYEGSVSGPESPRLGMTLASAHRAMDARRAVGLPEVTGLLVKTVDRDGRADRAGIRTGDVLARAGGLELRSIGALHAARDAADGGALTISGIRGADAQFEVTLDLETAASDPYTGIAVAETHQV